MVVTLVDSPLQKIVVALKENAGDAVTVATTSL
jgi:hypothetical protein